MKTLQLVILLILVGSFNFSYSSSQVTEGFRLHSTSMSIDMLSSSSAQVHIIHDIEILVSQLTEILLHYQFILTSVTTSINSSIAPNFLQVEGESSTVEITSTEQLEIGDRIVLSLTATMSLEVTDISANESQLFINWNSQPMAIQTSVNLTLPLGTYIATSQGTLDIFPQSTSLSTDGQRIKIHWSGLSSTSADARIFVKYIHTTPSDLNLTEVTSEPEDPSSLGNFFFWVLIPLILILGFGTVIMKKYPHLVPYFSQPDDVSSQNQVKIIETIKPVILKPNELEVLNAISDAGGSIYQSDLVAIFDVTKARMSQYLAEFEEKGLIKKEKMGRQNLIVLNIDERELGSA